MPDRTRSRIAPFVALGIAAVIALLFVVFAGADPDKAESADTPLLNRVAPPTVGRLEGGDGRTWDLSRRKGSWVVLNFFDSTCVPCRNEHPELLRFDADQDAQPDGAELVTIVWGREPGGAVEFFAEEGRDWPMVFDHDGAIATAYGVTQVPETWIIDPRGIVAARFIGEVTADGLSQRLGALQAVNA